MGLSISSIWERVWGMKDMRLLMVGLDAAGKVPPHLQFIVDTPHALILTSYHIYVYTDYDFIQI